MDNNTQINQINQINQMDQRSTVKQSHAYSKSSKLREEYINSLTFKEIDFDEVIEMRKAFSCCIYGKRGTGKSVFMKDMLSHIKKHYHKAYLFSETLEFQEEAYNFIPKSNAFDSFNEQELWKIWNEQKESVLRLEQKGIKKKDMPHVIIIFDDVITDKKIRTSQIYQMFAVQGRHACICTITLAQSISGKFGIPKVVRDNTDVIVSFFLEAEYDRDLFTSQYLSVHNKKEGDLILRKITTDKEHQVLIVNNIKPTDQYDKKVFTYIANPKLKPFRFKDPREPQDDDEFFKLKKIKASKIKLPIALRRKLFV
jgi:hypothetical protein